MIIVPYLVTDHTAGSSVWAASVPSGHAWKSQSSHDDDDRPGRGGSVAQYLALRGGRGDLLRELQSGLFEVSSSRCTHLADRMGQKGGGGLFVL